MARLKGVLPLEGSVGNLSFVKDRSGTVVRQKGGIPAQRIKTDPAYERTRENNKEFATAVAAGKLLRTAFCNAIFIEPDQDWVQRLLKRTMRVVKSDTSAARGRRTASGGNLALLQGYEFNDRSKVGDRLFLPPVIDLDQETNTLMLRLDSFLPGCIVDAPDGTTDFCLSVGAAYIDFGEQHFYNATVNSTMIPYNHLPHSPLAVDMGLPAVSGLPLVMTLGMEFYKRVRHIHCPVDDGRQNAAAIVRVFV